MQTPPRKPPLYPSPGLLGTAAWPRPSPDLRSSAAPCLGGAGEGGGSPYSPGGVHGGGKSLADALRASRHGSPGSHIPMGGVDMHLFG